MIKRKKLIYNKKCNLCGFGGYRGWQILRVHHKKPISEGGNDHPDNLVVLCANCHAVIHYLMSQWEHMIRKQSKHECIMWSHRVDWQFMWLAQQFNISRDNWELLLSLVVYDDDQRSVLLWSIPVQEYGEHLISIPISSAELP